MITNENIPPVYSKDNLKIRLHVDSLHTHFGVPYASQSSMDLLNQMNNADYKEEVFFVNNTYQNVSVMGRNGLAISIPYVPSCTSREFIIRKILKIKGFSLASAITSIQSLTNVDDAELQEIKQCLLSVDQHSYTGASLMIEYNVSIEDFRDKGNTLYHYQTDLVLSFNDTVKMDAHPYCARFLGIGTFGQKNDYANQKELNLKVRYVNHSPNAGPIYLNLLGKVFMVHPQKDAPSRRILVKSLNGKHTEKIYPDYIQFFYSSHNEMDVLSSEGVTHLRMTLEEAKIRLGVYDNYNDAFNSGNIEAKRKEELLGMTHQLELLKQSTAIEKAKLDKEDIARKEALLEKEHQLELLKRDTLKQKQELEVTLAELAITVANQKEKQSIIDIKMQEVDNEKRILDMQRKTQDEKIDRERKEFDVRLKDLREDHEHRLKQESLYWRDFYENRSQQRKDSSEFVRYVPGLLLGLAGVATAWFKFSSVKTE